MGGYTMTVRPNTEIFLFAQFSIDRDRSPKDTGPSRLSYKWTCKSVVKGFCDKGVVGTGVMLTIPKKYVQEGKTIQVFLEVKTQFSDPHQTFQTIILRKNYGLMGIVCVQNCDRAGNIYSNDKSDIVVKFTCGAFCKGVSTYNTELIYNGKPIPLPEPHKMVEGSGILRIPANFVKEKMNKPKGIYLIRVTAKNNRGQEVLEGQYKIQMADLISANEKDVTCKIEPTEGKSLITKFRLTCTVYQATFKIFEQKSGLISSGVLIATTTKTPIYFILTGQGDDLKLLVKIKSNEGGILEKIISVKVTSLVDSSWTSKKKVAQIKAMYDGKVGMFGSFPKLVSENNENSIMQLASILLDEMNALPLKTDIFVIDTFVHDMKKKFMEQLLELPMKGDYEYLQFISLAQKLALLDTDTAQGDVQALLGKYCLKCAELQRIFYENEKHPEKREVSVPLEIEYFFNCAEDCFKKNFEDKLSEKPEAGSQGEGIDEVVATEKVEDYDVTDQKDIKSQFSIATTNGIRVMEISGRELAYPFTCAKHKPYTWNRAISSLKIFSETLQEFNAQLKQFPRVKVTMKTSKEYISSQCISTLTIYFKKESNPFWWDIEEKFIATDFMHVIVFGGNGFPEQPYLGQPIKFDFQVVSASNYNKVQGYVAVPADKSKWIPDFLDYNMTVQRIDIVIGSNFNVKIDCERTLKVVLIPNRRPHYADFKNAQTVKNGEEISFTPTGALSKRNFWLYIGILPDFNALSGTDAVVNTTFTLEIISQVCRYWGVKVLKFISEGCRVVKGETRGEINCECDHLSTFVGMIQQFSNLRNDIIVVNHEINLLYDYAAFFFVGAVFLLYCIIIAIGVTQTRKLYKKNKTIFLADNVRGDRYAYLTIVKTGLGSSSGTTANIGIQLEGDKRISRRHVLNYPDPNKHFLQSGCEDYFLMTTERHLGTLQFVHLWTDSLGMYPDWYCDHVTIVDIQTGVRTKFEVKKWVSVLNKGETEITVEPFVPEEKKPTGFKKFLGYCKKLGSAISTGPNTFNIFSTSRNDDLTFIQKVTIVLSIIYTTAVVAMAMIGWPRMRMMDGFGYGHFHITYFIIVVGLVSSIVAFIVHCCIHLMFRYSNIIKADQEDSAPTPKQKRVNALAWMILIFLILLNMTLLLTFGFWLPHITGLIWLVTVAGALLMSIIILENVYRLALYALKFNVKKAEEKVESLGQLIREIEHQRIVLFSKFGDYLLRPYLYLKYYPLTLSKAEERKQLELRRQELATLLWDLFLFVIYSILLFILILADRDRYMIYSNHGMIERFTKSRHVHDGIELNSVRTVKDIYTYINKTLIATIHPLRWYGNWYMVDPGVIKDFKSRLLGVVQMRQLRVEEHSGTIPEQMKFLNLSSEPDWSSNIDGSFAYSDTGRLKYIWFRQSDEETGSSSWNGIMNNYPASGFVAYLGRTLYNSNYNFQYLEAKEWIDYYTRVVFLEFWVYNVHYNIFHAITIVFEKTASGWVVPTVHVVTLRLLVDDVGRWIFVTGIFVVFILINIRQFLNLIIAIVKQRLKFFKNFWNIVDLLIILLCLVCLGLRFYDYYLTERLLKKLDEAKFNEFVPFTSTFNHNRIYNMIAAFLICFVVLRLWKYLRFCLIFQILERTLLDCVPMMILHGIRHIVMILMFAFSGILLFGRYSPNFQSRKNAITSLLLMSINLEKHIDWPTLQFSHPLIGYFYYAFYMYASLYMVKMYIVIIIFAHLRNMNINVRTDVYNMKRYVTDKGIYLKDSIYAKIKDARLRGGADPDPDQDPDKSTKEKKTTNSKKKLCYPRDEEVRYGKCESMPDSRFELMVLIAKGVVRNSIRKMNNTMSLSEEDYEIMRQIAVNVCNKNMGKKKKKKGERKPEEKELFFQHTQKVKGVTQIHMVSDDRLRGMEFIVNEILVDRDDDVGGGKPYLRVSLVERLAMIEKNLDSLKKVIDNIEIYD